MKSLDIIYTYGALNRFTFIDDDKADVAYLKLKTAMDRQYSTNNTPTIEIDHDGGLATIKVEHMDCVVIDDVDPKKHEVLLRRRCQDEYKVNQIRREFGLAPIESED